MVDLELLINEVNNTDTVRIGQIQAIVNAISNTGDITSQFDTIAISGSYGDLKGVPMYLTTPMGNGLFIDGTHMGYYASNVWKTYIDNTGKFYFAGQDASHYISYNGISLGISGDITMTNQSSILISGFNNNSGFTDDTVANAAYTYAGNAYTLASGKNMTSYGGAAPSYPTAGDFWIDTSGGAGNYLMKRWSGSSWVSVGVYMDSSGIYTGTLTAGQINAVTINAVNITGGSITGTTITGGTLQTALNLGTTGGQGIIISGSGTNPNVIRFFDGLNNEMDLYGVNGYLYTASRMSIDGGLTMIGGLSCGRNGAYWFDIDYLGRIDHVGNVSPSSANIGYVLRSDSHYFTPAQLQFSDLGGTISTAQLNLGTTTAPSTNSADLTTANVYGTGGSGTTVLAKPTTWLTIYNSSGTAYKVPAY